MMEESSEEEESCLFPSSGLFAAAGFLDIGDQDAHPSTSDQQTWLTNESFKKDVNTVNKIEEDGPPKVSERDSIRDQEHKKRKHKKEKKKKSKKTRTKSPDESKELKSKDERTKKSTTLEQSELFRVDRKFVKDALMYDSLYACDVPKYRLDDRSKSRKHNSNKNLRYFKVQLGKCMYEKATAKTQFKSDDNFVKLIDTEPVEQIESNKPITDETSTSEINYDNPHLYRRTREFNSHLNQYPNDVNKWIEFIRFQDELIFELNNEDLRDKSAKSKTANDIYLTEKKLAVVERALKANAADVRLMILKLDFIKLQMEPDKLNEEWNKLIFIYPTNFEIIKNYMKFILTHISFFNVTNLNKFFGKYMEKIVQYQEGHLKSIRDQTPVSDLERSMLEVLLFYSIVLRQCGYVEKSVSIWQALIEFNFNTPDLLNDAASLEDCKEYFEVFWSSGEARFGEKESIGWKNVMKRNQGSKKELDGGEDEKSKLLNDKENEVVLNSVNDLNKIWFEIEVLRERYCWLSGKPHEDSDDADHIVLFEDISPCLFRFKDARSYQHCLLYFLCSLNAIKFKQTNDNLTTTTSTTDEMVVNLPLFFSDNEEQLLPGGDSKLFTPKYFIYDQRLKFAISIFQQAMSLVENRKSDYHQLVNFYLKFIVDNVKLLNRDQSRKLFKQVLKKPSNCGEIRFWKKFVDLEVQLSDITSAKNIYNKILDMLINQQSNQQQLPISSKPMSGLLNQQIVQSSNQVANESLLLIHDFIEFNLCIHNIKHNSLSMINCFRIDESRKEKEIGEEILLFIYSLINSRTFASTEELSSPVQLRTIRCINRLLDECFEQFYADYFRRLLLLDVRESPIKILEQISAQITQQMNRAVQIIPNKSSSDYLVEHLYEKHLDLHLLFLKYNFHQFASFNKLLHQAIQQFPTNRYFLTLLVNTEPARFVNGQIEKFTIRLCRKVHESTLEQWLFVIYSEMQRLSNIQTQSIQDFVSSPNAVGLISGQSKAIDHTGTYSLGLATRIRNLFEKALQTHNCLLLWRLFMHFEVNQNNLAKAKILFYRAVQQCPWSKILYMDGVKIFTMMSTTMDQAKSSNANKAPLIQNAENLNDVLDLMIEKQLRVRTAVEEAQFLFDNQQHLNAKH